MPTELEELVEFLHHGNAQIRQIAAENLVGFSQSQPSLFKSGDLTPIKDLKLLVKDYAPIAQNALTMLINLSADPIVLQNLAKDDDFITTILTRVTDPKSVMATELCMLTANLSKHESFQRVLSLKLPKRKELSPTPSSPVPTLAIDHLLTVFLLGESGKYNQHSDYSYLTYAFAELAKHPDARRYFVTPRQDDDDDMPLSKVLVFTEHRDTIRRRGVANVIKNVCFELDAQRSLLEEANMLPFILLPLMGSEEYPDDETEGMPDELQLLSPDKEREKDVDILKTHVESLTLLSSTREGRDFMRRAQVYPIIRELHMAVEDDGVRDECDRLVNVIMRKEEGEEEDLPPGVRPIEGAGTQVGRVVEEAAQEDDDEDMAIVEVA